MSTLDSFHDAGEAFTSAIAQTTDWDAATPCEGWTAADVVAHVVDTQRHFLIERGFELGERPEGDPEAVWREHSGLVTAMLSDPAVADTTYDGWFGPTTVGASMATFYGFDLLAHRWDLTWAQGSPSPFTDAEMDTLEEAIDGFGEALYSEGVCQPALPVDDDAPRQTRILARLGRSDSAVRAG